MHRRRLLVIILRLNQHLQIAINGGLVLLVFFWAPIWGRAMVRMIVMRVKPSIYVIRGVQESLERICVRLVGMMMMVVMVMRPLRMVGWSVEGIVQGVVMGMG